MSFSAKIIADSINPWGNRITSMQLRYPRFIHAEFMTHRVFSRNASSSRAIPVERLIEDIKNDTAMPIHWGKNQPGMQADEECNERINVGPTMNLSHEHNLDRIEAWRHARDQAIANAMAFHKAGYHKQIVNRLLEPFSHINTLVTATDWDNFFELRLHKDAQPEIQALALHMKYAMDNSTPDHIGFGEWHLPYILPEEKVDLESFKSENYGNFGDNLYALKIDTLIRMSVARAARVSYLTQDGKPPNQEQDLKLYSRLVGAVPLHASPAEHQCRPINYPEQLGMQKNFKGWIPYRSLLENR